MQCPTENKTVVRFDDSRYSSKTEGSLLLCVYVGMLCARVSSRRRRRKRSTLECLQRVGNAVELTRARISLAEEGGRRIPSFAY